MARFNDDEEVTTVGTRKKIDSAGSLNFTDELAQTVLNSLSAHIAIIDENGVILETNTAWRQYAIRSGMPETYDGKGV
ncbi:MAG: hypothetical protein WBV91_01695, partial [Desulfobacterales bacterium]